MAVLKNTVQVNNGNTGWNQGHVMDALEEIFGDLGWNSGTQKTGVPQCVVSPDGSVVAPGRYYSLGVDSDFEDVAPAVSPRSGKDVYYEVHANGTTAYRLLKYVWISNSDVNETENTFYEPDHQFETGDAVVWGRDTYYVNDPLDNIPELTYGTTYYVIKVDKNYFKIAASASDATAGTEIDISAKGGSSSVMFRRAFSDVSDNNDINVLIGDKIRFYNRTPGVPVNLDQVIFPGSGYAASGTDVPTTGGSGTGLTVDFTAFDGIIETATINTAGSGYIHGDHITITTGNGDAVVRVGDISGSLGQKFTLCTNVSDYSADALLVDENYREYSNGYENYPEDNSSAELNPPTLDADGGNGQNGLSFDTRYFRQTETNSFMPTELRFPDWDANDFFENSKQTYIYANNTTSGMTGNIILEANVFTSTSGNPYHYYDYTVPADGDRGALDLRFVRGSSNTPWGDQGELLGVYIMNVAEGWTAGETFTVPGDQIGGSTPTHDVNFGTATAESVSGANDAVLEVKVTNLGAGTSFFQRNENGLFGTLRLENDATKTYGTTYYTFGIESGNDPYQMWISCGSFMHWLNRKGTFSTTGSDYAYHSGREGLDYQQNNDTPNNFSSDWPHINFATATTPTAYPLKIYSYRAQAPQDTNFALIQFVQTINGVDQQYATFYLHHGNQIGTNIYDLDYVWQGLHGEFTSSGRTLYHHTRMPNYTYYTQSPSEEPAADYALAREAFYGYYRDSTDTYIEDFEDRYGCNIDTNNDHTRDAVTYFRDATYDDHLGYSVASQADYYRPIKGIPLSRKMLPSPYTLPDDFALLQVSTSPGLTNFRPGDTITISASEVYEVVRAAWQTNQNSLDNLDDSSSMGTLLLARTT